jgi:hypothetical protein
MQRDDMTNALATIGVHTICDKHAPGEDRCKGSGFVCGAHPHVPPAPLVKGGCECGATVVACAVARRSPIVVRIPVNGWMREVRCTVSDDA